MPDPSDVYGAQAPGTGFGQQRQQPSAAQGAGPSGERGGAPPPYTREATLGRGKSSLEIAPEEAPAPAPRPTTAREAPLGARPSGGWASEKAAEKPQGQQPHHPYPVGSTGPASTASDVSHVAAAAAAELRGDVPSMRQDMHDSDDDGGRGDMRGASIPRSSSQARTGSGAYPPRQANDTMVEVAPQAVGPTGGLSLQSRNASHAGSIAATGPGRGTSLNSTQRSAAAGAGAMGTGMGSGADSGHVSPLNQSMRSPPAQSPLNQSLTNRSPPSHSPLNQSLTNRSPMAQSPLDQSLQRAGSGAMSASMKSGAARAGPVAGILPAGGVSALNMSIRSQVRTWQTSASLHLDLGPCREQGISLFPTSTSMFATMHSSATVPHLACMSMRRARPRCATTLQQTLMMTMTTMTMGAVAGLGASKRSSLTSTRWGIMHRHMAC